MVLGAPAVQRALTLYRATVREAQEHVGADEARPGRERPLAGAAPRHSGAGGTPALAPEELRRRLRQQRREVSPTCHSRRRARWRPTRPILPGDPTAAGLFGCRTQ